MRTDTPSSRPPPKEVTPCCSAVLGGPRSSVACSGRSPTSASGRTPASSSGRTRRRGKASRIPQARSGWPGSSSATVGEQTTIDEDDTRRIATSDYADWELQIERLGGGEFQFEVDNAIQTGNYEGELTDDGLFAPRYTLASRWDPADLTASPHRIRILTGVS